MDVLARVPLGLAFHRSNDTVEMVVSGAILIVLVVYVAMQRPLRHRRFWVVSALTFAAMTMALAAPRLSRFYRVRAATGWGAELVRELDEARTQAGFYPVALSAVLQSLAAPASLPGYDHVFYARTSNGHAYELWIYVTRPGTSNAFDVLSYDSLSQEWSKSGYMGPG